MAFKPVIPFREDSIGRAFILNALILAVTAAASVELRQKLDAMEATRQLPTYQKLSITVIGAFCIGMAIYIAIRIAFGFGEGMLATKKMNSLF